jgi:methionyl-tRNA formyltransferase
LSIVFLGTTDFAASILDRLAARPEHRPSLVLTRPDRPRGRGRRLSSPPVAEHARALGLALEQPENVNDEQTAALIAAVQPAAIVVCAFGALIREPLLSAHLLLNVHPSLLPRWRGAAPLERAIIAGDERTGVSIMRLTAGLDSGPVWASQSEPIEPADSYGSLATRLQALSAELLLRALDELAAGRALAFAEQDEAGVTYAEKIEPSDRLLDPARPAVELERVVRALHPHIGARAVLSDGAMLGVQEAALAAPELLATGDQQELGLVERDGRLLLACAEGALELSVVQPPGGRPMDAASYLRGHGPPKPPPGLASPHA